MAFCQKYPGGAELEISMLFADVRGSTQLAEKMRAAEFGRLMNRFYREATDILVKTDAFIDKFVGDEVIGLYFPLFAGKTHSQAAIQAAQALLRVTQHKIPIGIGVHTGIAYVGTVSGVEGTISDITALGDNVNITARLASKASAGEALISHAAYEAAGPNLGVLEQRQTELKGKNEPFKVWVMK